MKESRSLYLRKGLVESITEFLFPSDSEYDPIYGEIDLDNGTRVSYKDKLDDRSLWLRRITVEGVVDDNQNLLSRVLFGKRVFPVPKSNQEYLKHELKFKLESGPIQEFIFY